MKIIFSISLSLIFCLALHAQVAQPKQIVYLTDGSSVRGTVTVNDSAGYVLVVDRSKESHYYDKAKVAKIAPEEDMYAGSDLKKRGYVCAVDFGATNIFAKDNGGNISMFSANVLNSYQFSPIASAGLGLGLEMASSGYNLEMFSIYANTRIYFTRRNISPFADISLGYYGGYYGGGGSVKDGDHGMMFNPAMGLRVGIGRKAALTVGLGYKFYYIHNYGTFNENTADANFVVDSKNYYLFHAITFRAGIQF
jgi:hypothetical protein